MSQASQNSVVFLYNGHNWDAYEVLGVLPTASDQEVESAYQLLVENLETQSHEFARHAVTAIRRARGQTGAN